MEAFQQKPWENALIFTLKLKFLLLNHVFKNFRKMSILTYNLARVYYYTTLVFGIERIL